MKAVSVIVCVYRSLVFTLTTNASSRVGTFRGIADSQHDRTTGAVNDHHERSTSIAAARGDDVLGRPPR
jgi:hypothetical protein